MKKLVYTFIGLFLLNSSIAQVSVSEDNNIKNFRFGLLGDMTFNWLNSSKKTDVVNGGVGLGLGWGMQMEFRLNKTISFTTGLSMQSAKYKLDYASVFDSVYYVLNANNDYVDISNNKTGGYDTTSQRRFLLESRTYVVNTINIPLFLKMKTNEIGYMTYFGEFGANININYKGKSVLDNVKSLADTTYTVSETFNQGLNMTKSINKFNIGLKVGGGFEYNFSGTTSLFAGVHYNHYFFSSLKTNDKYIQTKDKLNPGTFKSAGIGVVPGAVSLTVGILF